MDSDITKRWLIALGVFAGATALGFLVKAIVVRRLASVLSRTKTEIDDLVLRALRRHLPLWFLLGGLAIGARLAPFTDRIVALVENGAAAAFMISLALAASHFGTGLLGRYARRSGSPAATTSLVQNVLRAAVLALGLLLVLANLGVSITPLLTALGVGSVAVALALQPTLSNLIAGIHMTLSRPIRVGDFVEIEGGSKGFVVDIGWRATRIRELPNNIIVVPNNRLGEMVVTNYAMPEPEQSVVIQVGVSYRSDMEEVERVTIEVARQTLREVQGGVATFEPFTRYHTFGDSSINFSVILRVQTFVDRYLVTHEFLKRLKARYDREGIEIPFPQRVLHGAVEARVRSYPGVGSALGREGDGA